MQCTPWVAISFIFCALAYGSSSAAAAEGLKGWTPEMLIMLRMAFGFLFCLVVLIVRILVQPGYKQIVRAHFFSGFWPYFHLAVGGLLNLGIPHSLIYIAQQWIPSCAVQLAKPLTPIGSALAGLCMTTDEKFTLNKGLALASAIIGVALGAIPSFRHTGGNTTVSNVVVGYVLLVIATSLFGLAATYFKWKTPNADITVSSLMQTFFSFWFDLIWSLIMDTPKVFVQKFRDATAYDWLWPILLGVVGSGIAVHGFMYLVNTLGAVGAGFIPFGQIIVGVTIGVGFLGEWDAYAWWEIGLQVVGIVFLSAAILIGFIPERGLIKEEHELEEEDQKEAKEGAEEETSDELPEL
jgi:drug/metabolite transporter (DMT)-like permease